MDTIPPDLYEEVRELALAITNAGLAEDEILLHFHRQKLRDYYHVRLDSGKSHPFLTETLADYTEDNKEAIDLYLLAITQAKKFVGEPIHTKQISLASRLIEIGKMELAEAYLHDALETAKRSYEEDTIREAQDLLGDIR